MDMITIKILGISDFTIGGPTRQIYSLAAAFAAATMANVAKQLAEGGTLGALGLLAVPFGLGFVMHLFYQQRKRAIWGAHCGSCAKQSPMDRTCIEPIVNDRVLVVGYTCTGTVRFVGKNNATDKLLVGVELDQPIGDNDGNVDGVWYFRCPPNCGLLASPNKVSLIPTGGSSLMPAGCSARADDRCRHGAKDIIRSSIIGFNKLWAEVDFAGDKGQHSSSNSDTDNTREHPEARGPEAEVSAECSLKRKWQELGLDNNSKPPKHPNRGWGWSVVCLVYSVWPWLLSRPGGRPVKQP